MGIVPIGPIGGSLVERFHKYVRKTDGCWEWTGSKLKGYGRLYHNGRLVATHRLSWTIHYGPVPDAIYVCHKCDNRGCVRPSHLFLGTHSDNIRDSVRKGRHGSQRNPHLLDALQPHPEQRARGERSGRHKLTNRAVHEIRALAGTLPIRLIAERYAIDRTHAYKIIRRELWTHLI